MHARQEDLAEFRRQLGNGSIQRAYRALLSYILDLQTHFKSKYGDSAFITAMERFLAARMYSYQFTLVRPHLFGLRPNVLMLALTDFATGWHTYAQQTALTAGDITIDRQGVRWGDAAQLIRGAH